MSLPGPEPTLVIPSADGEFILVILGIGSVAGDKGAVYKTKAGQVIDIRKDIPTSGLYAIKDLKCVYTIDAKTYFSLEFFADASLHKVYVVVYSLKSRELLVELDDGKEAHLYGADELQLTRFNTRMQTWGWIHTWVSGTKNAKGSVTISVTPGSMQVGPVDIPLASAGEIRIDTATGKLDITAPVNYVWYYGVILIVVVLAMPAVTMLRAFRRSRKGH